MIYFLKRSDGLVKIGTAKNYHNRLGTLRSEYGELTLLGWQEGSYKEESALHNRFADDWHEDEFFNHSPTLDAYIQTVNHTEPEFIKTSHHIRLSRHTEIALELLQLHFINKLQKPRISLGDTLWELIKTYNPELAAESLAEYEASHPPRPSGSD